MFLCLRPHIGVPDSVPVKVHEDIVDTTPQWPAFIQLKGVEDKRVAGIMDPGLRIKVDARVTLRDPK